MKMLLILSGKGGTGKTTTAAAFIQFSKSRAIADCDVDAPNLHIVTEKTMSVRQKNLSDQTKRLLMGMRVCIAESVQKNADSMLF